MLARKLEQVEPLVDVGREDRIARHPVGKFRVVEWCVRVDGALGRRDALSFPQRR
jgi:hypothetical protein